MSFQILPLSRERFAALFGLQDEDLAARHAVRVIADEKPGFPCRIALADAEPGDELVLVNFTHQPAESPYRSSHAIYLGLHSSEAKLAPNTLPAFFAGRALSLRAFNDRGMMTGAELTSGSDAEGVIEAMLDAPEAAYLHAHFAKYGCYACRIERC